MRLIALTVAVGLVAPAAAQDAPKAVVEKAIKAHGGAELLGKFTAQKVKLKGSVAIMGMDVDVTATTVTQFPGKRKVNGVLSIMGQELKIAQVLNGDNLSVSINGQPLPANDEQKASEKQELYADNLALLVPLLKDEYTLKAGPEVAVAGDPAVSVVVEHDKQKPVTLSFDKKSGLLVRLAYKGTDEGAEVEKVSVFSDYKAVQGVQMPHKTSATKDGKKESELTAEKIELLEKIDDAEFAAD